VQVLAHPFRFVNGKVAHLDSDDDQFAAQRIAAAVLTGIGEAICHPDFGSLDPEFMSFDSGAFITSASNHLDGIIIDDVVQMMTTEGTPKISIFFSRM
jgi:hypothetical protein